MSRRRRLVLHIGMHKTGTTSIQHALDQWRGPLFTRAGILYPSVGRAAASPQQHLNVALAYAAENGVAPQYAPSRRLNRRVLIDALKQEIALSGAPTTVLSSEEFWWRAEIPPAIAKDFASFDIVPVAFVRDYAEVVERSAYTSVVQLGQIDEDPARGYLEANIPAVLRAWSTIAKDSRITVLDYDALPQGDAIAAMLEVLDVSQAELQVGSSPFRRLNGSGSLLEVLAHRALRGIDDPDGRARLEALLRRMPTSATFLDAATRKALQEKFVVDMKALSGADFVSGLVFDEDVYWRNRVAVECVPDLPALLLHIARSLPA
ncbi:MAG: hypothetical protein U1E46_07985 [Hyphomicrobiales bacterium]